MHNKGGFMKKILILTAVIILISTTALAKTTTIKKYDKHGNYQGKYVSDGAKTKIYKNGA